MSRKHAGGPVTFYEGEYYMFSNFSAFAIYWRGQRWDTVEHAYQAEKFIEDAGLIRERIRKAPSAHHAKKLARRLARRYPKCLRPDWQERKIEIMADLVGVKLEQHLFIRKKLLATGHRLIIEASPKDGFWGWGPDGRGKNHLGKIWMQKRLELERAQEFE